MKYLLLSVITLIISTISGDVEITIMKATPRLNNLMYCDYYFACHAEGETLQWKINNSNIGGYSEQSLDYVFTGSISTCNYITTLLLLKPIPPGQSIFDSVLIVSCQNSINFDVTCTNGSVSSMTNSPEKSLTTTAENSIPSINLEHVLSANLVAANSSSCTNIFACGVNDNFIVWQVQEMSFAFTEFDNIGIVRQFIQDTTAVKRQAILIGNKPYNLVVVMIVIGSAEINVTCGHSDIVLSLTSIPCPSDLDTTGYETSIGSETSTASVGEPSTIASPGGNIFPQILVSTFSVVAVFVVIIIVILLILCCLHHIRNRSSIQTTQENMSMNETEAECKRDNNNFSEAIKPKKMMNIDYNEFFESVQYIFLTRNENTFNAATTILTAPDIEKTTNKQITSIDDGVYIGMIGSHRVCLVNEIEMNFVGKLKKVIIQYFSNSKYLIFVGRCFAIDHVQMKLADVLISKCICHAADTNGHHIKSELIAPEIRSKFCFYPEKVEGLQVAEGRTAKHFVVKIASGVNILDNKGLRNFLLTDSNIYGYEETSEKLLDLYKNGINMGNNTTKQMQVITIGAVTGYIDEDTCDDFLFIASKAAFHYVASKMKYPHESGKISYEIKKPKEDYKDYNKFAEFVEYIIVTIGRDEFDAVTTYISAPIREENIMEIAKDVYIGMIGSHYVGLLFLHHLEHYYIDMKNAIDNYFPYAKYLIHVGGGVGVDPNKTKLGDVMISKEIFNIDYDGKSYDYSIINMTPEIQDLLSNSDYVEGLQLPGDRKAEHFEVRIATGTGADIETDEHMKNTAIKTRSNYGYDNVGGDIFCLQRSMISEREIHFILINGVYCYGYSRNYDEWNFVASQAAIHYVASKINKL